MTRRRPMPPASGARPDAWTFRWRAARCTPCAASISTCTAGETLCIVGEMRVRQVADLAGPDGSAGEAASSAARSGIDFDGIDLLTASQTADAALRGDRMAMIFQEPMTSLNPAYTIGDQLAEALRLHRRSAATGRVTARSSCWRRSASRRRASRLSTVPPPAVGRSAPAGDDRHGADVRARPDHRGRADHGARRDHSGADPAPAGRSARARWAWR